MVLLLLQFAATLYMTGVIWFVQWVHYPLMRMVHVPSFADFERQHRRLTTRVVAPAMLVEAAAVVAIARQPPAGISPWTIWLSVALLMAIWLATAALSVPCHQRLSQGFDAACHRRLVRENWIRTLTWTARSLLAGYMLFEGITEGFRAPQVSSCNFFESIAARAGMAL